MKRFHRIYGSLGHFFSGHSFSVLTVICVAVIAATALWTRRIPAAPPAATPPAADNRMAAALLQQTLPAATPTPLPTTQPLLWEAPLADVHAVLSFSLDEMVRSDVTGLWSIHAATDLAAEAGAPVMSMAPGRILDCGSDALRGTWISVSHTGGFVSTYSSLSLLGALRPGDPVSSGQTIGFAGNTAADEVDLGSHLHLEVTCDGQPVDPLALLLSLPQ